MPAWNAEVVVRNAVSSAYTPVQQADGTVTTVLNEILATAQLGITALTAIRTAATKCLAATAAPHLNGAVHGADGSPARTAAVAMVSRAFSRLHEGLNLSRLTSTGVPLGCQQELEHPGGGDVEKVPTSARGGERMK